VIANEQPPTSEDDSSPFQALPSVNSILELVQANGTSQLAGEALTSAVSDEISLARGRIESGERPSRAEVVSSVLATLARLERPKLQPVINATGVIVHTNLGRSMVSAEAATAMAEAASSYVALEIDPDTNERGGRMSEIGALFRALTGAESSLVVNNNAAAVLLLLSAVAAGRSVVLSRGEAVEIGGGFRVPDVMRQSGANLVEVGTTNRTYARDYERAVNDETAALLKVHPSNFQISGFVHAATVAELAEIARARHIPVIEDLGSGALVETERFGLAHEPTIAESLAAGADIVTASGDKLLGGPQAGLILGSKKWIAQIEKHPLARAVRADKTCLAGTAATLRHYANGNATEKIPIWRMIAATAESLQSRANSIASQLNSANISVRETKSTVGGGSLPGQVLPSWALAFEVPKPDDVAKRLRIGSPGVFGRLEDQRIILDLRSILPEQDDDLLAALERVFGDIPSGSQV
jgi:L-seryl-tRNA(Ser) seleniumtransferase